MLKFIERHSAGFEKICRKANLFWDSDTTDITSGVATKGEWLQGGIGSHKYSSALQRWS